MTHNHKGIKEVLEKKTCLPEVLKEKQMGRTSTKVEQKCETARNKKSRFSFLLIENIKAFFSKISFNLCVISSRVESPKTESQEVCTEVDDKIELIPAYICLGQQRTLVA